jgi:alpha-D-ribose 1-methylphosphonate 5-triphosphate diphosphatase PhnM
MSETSLRERVARAMASAIFQDPDRCWTLHTLAADAAIALVVEEAARVANVFPRGSAYASENADIYRAQEEACARAVQAILRLKEDKP